MASSTNATRLFWGTAWTSRTLLRVNCAPPRSRAADGYGAPLCSPQMKWPPNCPRMGSLWPRRYSPPGAQPSLIRTQYYAEEIDAEAGMFPPARRALMQGTHTGPALPAARQPVRGVN
jgi:hypothetical protein